MSYEDRTHRLCRGSYKSWTVGCLRGRRETEREEEMLKHRHGVRESAAMTVASVGVGVRAYSWRSKLSLSVEWLLSSCSDESDSWPLTRTWSTCMSMIVITLHSYMDEVLVQRRARWHRLDCKENIVLPSEINMLVSGNACAARLYLRVQPDCFVCVCV